MESLLLISGKSGIVCGTTSSETFSGITSPRSLEILLLLCSIKAFREALLASSLLLLFGLYLFKGIEFTSIRLCDLECSLFVPLKLIALPKLVLFSEFEVGKDVSDIFRSFSFAAVFLGRVLEYPT